MNKLVFVYVIAFISLKLSANYFRSNFKNDINIFFYIKLPFFLTKLYILIYSYSNIKNSDNLVEAFLGNSKF